jgi:oligosaccharyltransferase complex subunit epsilon
MAPKKSKAAVPEQKISSTPSRHPTTSSNKSTSFSISRVSIAANDLLKSYRANTPNSLVIIDAFLVFLMYVGAVQFVYACLTGGYPFNSFLAGFSAAVGQFVLAGNSTIGFFKLIRQQV